MTRPRAVIAPPRMVVVGALTLGVAASVISLAGSLVTPQAFFEAYLVAYVFWVGLALGCLTLLMLHHLVGGEWSRGLAPALEAGASTMPLLGVLLLPLLLGLSHLYPWAQPDVVAADPTLQRQEPYLNIPFFVIRGIGYLGVWSVFALLFRRWTISYERTGEPALATRLRRLSGGGVVVIALTATFAMIDWVMSLDPRWHSSIHPAVIGIGALLGAFAIVIAVVEALGLQLAPEDRPPPRFRNDLGGLFIAFAVLWGYLAYSQFLLVWSGNLPEEIGWYLPRLEGGWQWFGVAAVGGQLVVPLLLLVPRRLRVNSRVMLLTAGAVLLAHGAHVFWSIAPAFHDDGIDVHWLDLTTVLAVGGLWVGAWAWLFARRPLVDAPVEREQRTDAQ